VTDFIPSDAAPERLDANRPHVLIVRDVGETYGPFSTDEFADYEVEHHADCPQQEHHMTGPDGEDETWTAYTCGVGHEENEGGSLRWSLRYSGAPIESPGVYVIEPWFEKYYVHDYDCYEYDGGVALSDDDTAAKVLAARGVPS